MTKNINPSFDHAVTALSLIPESSSAAMLVRHAARYKIERGHGNDVLLTSQGKQDAFAMGELIGERMTRLLHSPVPRCLQTAEQMQKGGGTAAPEEWSGLRCDVYVEDFQAALGTLGRLVSEEGFYDNFVEKMSLSGQEVPYPHFRSPLTGAGYLMRHLLFPARPGICVGVTHDWILNVAVSYATGEMITRPNYADFLDALFLWKIDEVWKFYYKGKTGICPSGFVSALTPD